MVTCTRCEVECADQATQVRRQNHQMPRNGTTKRAPFGTPRYGWLCPECDKEYDEWLRAK